MFTCVLGLDAASTVLLVSTQAFGRPLTASVDSCAEIKESPVLAELGGRCRKAVLGVCNRHTPLNQDPLRTRDAALL